MQTSVIQYICIAYVISFPTITNMICLSVSSNIYFNTAQTERDRVCCPLCRQTTHVAGGDISKLGTNLVVQSLIDELAAKVHYCTICDDKKLAITFCTDCDHYMCDSCKQKHDDWKMNSGHEQFSMEAVNAGKTRGKKKVKCNLHGKEKKDLWCLGCKKYICPRCRIVAHSKHDVVEAGDHEKNHKKKIAALMARVETKKNQLGKHAAFVKDQKTKAKAAIQEPIKQIEAARDDAISRIKERSDLLISQCKKHEQLITSKLDSIVGENDMQTACIESAGELVKSGTRGRLEGDALVAHNTFCAEMEKLVQGCEIDSTKVNNLVERAVGFVFTSRCNESVRLGDVGVWKLKTEMALTTKDSMESIAGTPDGRMAVECNPGGIEIYSAEGQLQQTLLKDVKVQNVGFLSDGRYVVSNRFNNVSMYTSECEKLDVGFETLNGVEGGRGDLTVNSDDQIYVSYREAKKIQVFTSAGGKAVREITCDGYVPSQIFANKSSKRLVVMEFGNSVIVIDDSGEKKHRFVKDVNTYHTFPCVGQDGSILIASIKFKQGLVSIDRYTDELQHVQTLITDHKIDMTQRKWFYLQEFLTGEIALCSSDKLYIFHRSVTPDDL